MIDKDGKVYRGLQAQVAYLTEKVENGGGGSTPTGPTVDKITALDLAAGEAALTYDANNGATIVKQGQISADGNTFDVAIEDKLPIVPGDNVTIGATADGKHLKISATGGGGSGVAGVSSFGGKTGAINVGKNLSMNGNVVNADFQPTPVVLDADANLGTLTDNQFATLQANDANPIVKRNEYYYLNDKQYDPGTLGYTHLGYENGKWYAKSITITISTKGWVKKSSDIPDKTIIPFISLSGDTSTYPITGNFTSEAATKLISSPFSVISFTPSGSAIQVPLLLQPSETIHNSYVYSGHDDSYVYTINATLSSTSTGTWLAKRYVITRAAYVTPVITTIDGVSGEFTLGSNLQLENRVITATNTVTTVNGHTGAVNIIGGSNVSINDVGGTLTISATGGGGTSTDTGFSNVRRIEYADSQTNYDPDSGEYLNTTGTSKVYYKDNTSTTVPYVQTLGLMPGNNVTFTEEQVGNSWKVKVNATGGGGTVTFPAVDLTNATVPGSGSFTDEEANLLYYVNNKASFIMIQDTINELATYIVLPLVYLDSVHNYYIYESTVSGNTYTLTAVLQKTTGNVWGVTSYDITKTAARKSKLYQHTLVFQYTAAAETYTTTASLVNTYSGEMSLTPFLTLYGTDPVYGCWISIKQSTGKSYTFIWKIAATNNGFVITGSQADEHEVTLISDTVKEV